MQFAHSGHPIVGDVKYGARERLSDKSIRLCATRLEFKMATGGDKKMIEITVPEFFVKSN